MFTKETIKNFFKKIFTALFEYEAPKADITFVDSDEYETTGEDTVCVVKYTVNYAMGAYIKDCQGKKAESTIRGYSNIQKNYFEIIRYQSVDDLSPERIQEALDIEIHDGRSVKSVKNAFSFLKNVLQYSYDNGIMEEMIDLSSVKVQKEPANETT